MTRRQPGARKQSFEERFRLAQRFYRLEKFEEAERSAARLLENEHSPSLRARWTDALLICVFAAAKGRNFEGGWRHVERHGEAAAGLLDFCYAACYLAYQRADYDAARTWGRRYLELHAGGPADGMHRETASKQHEVLNTLGCAAKDRGQDREALEYLHRAMEAAPDYPLPYLNAAQVARRSGRPDEARVYIERGIAACGEVEELRMIERALATGPRISLCMIVKDEEEMLPSALDSVKGTVDEIIVVDTGSSDRTVEIARAHGAKVYHHAWENDFSKARNQSIEYATGDWILILDADERLDRESAPLVRKIAASCAQEAVSFSVYNIDLDNDHVSFLPSVRMFRNGRGYGYTGIVHNQINLPRECPVMRAPVRIDHYGYTPSIAEARRKFQRTTALLEKQLEADPDDAFAHFNMAQILRGGAQAVAYAPLIIAHATRVTELIGPDERAHLHILLMAYHQLASSHFLQEQYEEAEAACRKALELRPDFIDALMTLGHTLSIRRRYDEAREAFLAYLRARRAYREEEETAGFILLNLATQHQAHYGLGLIEEALGHYDVALEWYGKVAEAREDYLETHLRTGQIAYRLGRLDVAERALKAELKCRPDSFWGHYCLGDVAARRESWSGAYDHYAAAYRLKPDHPHLALNLSTLALRLGRGAEAAVWLEHVPADLHQAQHVKRTRAEVAMVTGDFRAATARYAEYLEADPDDAAAWLELGNAHFKCEERRRAEVCYRRALAADPTLSAARRNLALVAVAEKRYAAARAELEAYLPPDTRDSEAAVMLADLLAASGEHERALGWFERYLSLRPDDHTALFRLAASYQASGHTDAAIVGYRHVLAGSPDFTPAREALEALTAI
jgi:tetratricopeptide (TPR) repeat protein